MQHDRSGSRDSNRAATRDVTGLPESGVYYQPHRVDPPSCNLWKGLTAMTSTLRFRSLAAALTAAALLIPAAPAAASDGCPDGWEPRTVPGVSGTFCYHTDLGFTLGAVDARERGHLYWPDNDDDPTNTPPRAPSVPRIPSQSVWDQWADYNNPDDEYVQVPGGYVRRKLHTDGTTRCYFNGSDGSLYNYGEC